MAKGDCGCQGEGGVEGGVISIMQRRLCALGVAIGSVSILIVQCAVAQQTGARAAPIWTVPEIGALPDNQDSLLIRRGRDLITATYAHIGPEVPSAAKRYAGNNLACSNCHLEAGTKKFALPIFGLFEEFPRY